MENQPTFTQYELDRDIPQKLWDTYLDRYSKQYVLRIGEKDATSYKTHCIKCYLGFIEPYSLKHGLLLFYGKFGSPNKKAYFLRKIKAFPLEVLTVDYDEVTLKFKESSLHSLIEILHIKKRMQLSAAERKNRSDRLKKQLKTPQEAD